MQGDPYQVSLLVLCLKNFASSGAHKWLELYIGKELLKEPDIYPALFLFLFFFCFWHLIIKEIWRRETGLIYLDGRVNREVYNKKKVVFIFTVDEFLLNQVRFQKVARFEWASKDLTQEIFLQGETSSVLFLRNITNSRHVSR